MSVFVSNFKRGRAALPFVAVAAAACVVPGTASAGVALSTSGWEWSDPAPQGYSLYDVKFQGNRGYAVGAGGTALRSDDGGASWSGLFTGTSTAATSLDLISPDAIAIATGDGNCTIRLTVDGGQKFKVLPVAENEFSCQDDGFASFDFVSPTTGYVLRKGGGVITTSNGGDTFGSRSAVDGGVSIQFASDQVGFAASSNGKIYKTTDGAQTWNPIHDAGGPLTQIRLTSANDIIAWGKDRLVRSTDGGTTFSPGAINGTPARVSWSDPSHLAFISDAKLLLSADGGATVKEVTIGNKDVNAVAYVDGTRLVAVGNGGVTYTSSDAGENFARLSSDRIASSFGWLKNSPGGPVGIGSNGTIGRVVNGKWVLGKTLSSAAVVDADFSSANKGYVLQGNSLHQTTDNGATWKPISTGAPSSVSYISTPDDDTVLLFGGFGVLRATNGGAFEKVEHKLVAKLKPAGAHTALGRVTTWSGKSKTKPLISVDGGESWKAIALPKGIKRTSDIQPLPGKGLLLDAGGRIFRSSNDSGKKWTEITSLATNTSQGPGITVASATEYFAGVSGGDWGVPVVLHTTDAGKTWQPQAIGATNTSIKSLVAGGPKTGYVLSGTTSNASDNAIFATTTGGSRGNATTLSLSKTKSKLKRSAGKIQITGVLAGGTGGETVHVAIRKEGSSSWIHSNVIVGANGGGSFTATLRAGKGKYVAVAQWAGDSGRAGTGTSAKSFTVTK